MKKLKRRLKKLLKQNKEVKNIAIEDKDTLMIYYWSGAMHSISDVLNIIQEIKDERT